MKIDFRGFGRLLGMSVLFGILFTAIALADYYGIVEAPHPSLDWLQEGLAIFALFPFATLFTGAVIFVILGVYCDCRRLLYGRSFKSATVVGIVLSATYATLGSLYCWGIPLSVPDGSQYLPTVGHLWSVFWKPYLFAYVISILMAVATIIEHRRREGVAEGGFTVKREER